MRRFMSASGQSLATLFLVFLATMQPARAQVLFTGGTPVIIPAPPGTLALLYDQATGDLKVNYNGFIGFPGHAKMGSTANSGLSLVEMISNGADGVLFDVAALNRSAAGQTLQKGTIKTPIDYRMTEWGGLLPDGADMGLALPAGLTPDQLSSDLTVYFNYSGSGSFSGGQANMLVTMAAGVSTPEPASLSLMALGAVGLLGRRRRSTLFSAPIPHYH